jgi:hypothetical protein
VKQIIVPALVCAAVLLFAACEKKGPAETAGGKIDEAVRTMKNGGEKTPADKINDAAHDVQKDAQKAADDVKDEVKK